MDEEPRERRGGGQALAVLATVALLLLPLYALSVGPAMWLLHSGVIDQKYTYVFSVVYWPLEFLYNNVSLVKMFYDAYFRLLGIR